MCCIHNILSTCQLCYVSMEFYQPFHSCKRNFWRLWCQRLSRRRVKPPPPPLRPTAPGPNPPPPPLQCVPGQGQCIEMQRRCGMVWCCDSTVGLGSEHRAAFSCREGMCSRAAWYAGLSHNTWLCVKRRCIRCLLSRPCHGVGRAVGHAGA